MHSCLQNPTSSSHLQCSCDIIQQTTDLKYLGVTLDEKLNFIPHITTLSSRIRKTIGIMKKLRDVCELNVLKIVYNAICHSLLSYCIGVWGCAAKTHFILVERAQRALLKVMLRKPFRFSTNILYKEAQVLRVRQIYIAKACLRAHSSILKHEDYSLLLNKRVFRIPTHRVRTQFAARFPAFAFPTIYNRIVKSCDIKLSTLSEAKGIIHKWLQSLDYDSTENFLPFFQHTWTYWSHNTRHLQHIHLTPNLILLQHLIRLLLPFIVLSTLFFYFGTILRPNLFIGSPRYRQRLVWGPLSC